MNNCPFAISLNPAVQVTSTEDGYTLHGAESEPNAWLTLATTPGMGMALDSLKAGKTTPESLVQGLAEIEGQAAGEQFGQMLQQLDERGWLSYAVLPLAVVIPMVDSAELNLTEPYWTQTRLSLSRFAYQHAYEGTMVLESPLSKFRVKLLDWGASAILAQLAQPQTLGSLTPPPYLGAETAYQFLNLLWAAGFLTADPESPSLRLWEFHNLLFHSRSRFGRHDYLSIDHDIEQWSDFPVVKPPMSDQIVPLPRPNLGALISNDATLTEAIERRRSIRGEDDDNNPISIEQVGELLYRTARVKKILSPQESFGKFWLKEQPKFEEAGVDYGELTRRPYPSGGGMYELEIYVIVRLCQGLSQGVYHYDPLNHHLEMIFEFESDTDILTTSGYGLWHTLTSAPQVILVITARFGRLFRKYRSIAYALVLKHVGILQQNFYLVATNMGLAPTAAGAGDSDAFAGITGLDYLEESVVGEFMLGSLPNEDVKASGLESMEVDGSEKLTEAIISATDTEWDGVEAESEFGADFSHDVEKSTLDLTPQPSLQGGMAEDEAFYSGKEENSKPLSLQERGLERGFPDPVKSQNFSEAESVGLVAENPQTDVGESPENTSVQVEDMAPSNAMSTTGYAYAETPDSSSVAEEESESAGVSVSEVESSATPIPIALHPHELDDRIPGLAELHNQTLGDSRITIVILDGNPDHTLSCFAGANVSKVFPYWHEPAPPISPEDYATFQAIRDQGLKGKAKQEALESAIPDMINRVELNDHACHVTSTIVGQEHSPVFGIAPNCRVINMPHDAVVKSDNGIALSGYNEVLSPLNLARAFELALELGANIIHCAFCRPTQTSEGEEILVQAIKKCQDNNILIVAPVGNNSNECWCLPAVVSGTLPVGAANIDGTPCHFSNWGGNNTEEGILAPGEDILGAQPCTEKPVRLTGTSMAAPVMTGISALLMSLQLQEGKPVDAEAVRTALLNTAIPCDPQVVAEPERCLRGFVNIPGAMRVLFGQPSVTISFAGDQVTRTERAGYAMPSATVAPASIIGAMATDSSPAVQPATLATPTEASVTAADPATVEASTAYSGNVYALGTIGYDFGDETRRDTFKQLMAPSEVNGIIVTADPYDTRQMIEYLDRNPNEARSLIWTLGLDGDTIYVLEPTGAFSAEIYEMFLLMLAGQMEAETSDEFVERISVPARRTNSTVELFSGEFVPVVKVHDVRGMYGWKVNALVNAAMVRISRQLDEAQEPIVRQALTSFLNRVYNDLRNLGQTSRDRALNFAATNIFQAALTFAQAIVQRRQLDTITVEKSPFCRLNSDCWDVKLEFFDPESSSRARKVFRFTLDVVQPMPVTLGEVKSWSIPGKVS
ncbi:MAG: PatA/PatG family cyanobactin maturation protease [Microcoleus sp. PH2017_25_DOB_D_A]|uniref:PatA/PatG family cyanobactin maturation protease n=1 Tax=unclassified Microcoleus TaxID=2642155 RepID=UPI001D3E4025|nr:MULTISPECIES: PatA/PatG family cyanobactin maturation protease [unclassified Microcoleus]MCC3490648.1 PatA/PatG family cyanobactin maturation protease [Microcoleus sp. PH2017_16_JOR_D_A]MCC3535463.1 PatA/PatG family cyanobactin maturation protease [Microcoleus sp. PH2017_25_DOB_D_A]MCC3547625.1 PatA/PatG family cyanobactin maturation protease [Microcoleus sp. PH2017_24_DOB_U_A]TAE13742.1 MAG: PatA/PatG family cyanobactin maturation protease [Oscillatoriales cyanobacterium]